MIFEKYVNGSKETIAKWRKLFYTFLHTIDNPVTSERTQEDGSP